MIGKLRYGRQLWRYFGPAWLGYRAWYAIRRRVGLLQRLVPAVPWDKQPLADFLIDASLATPADYLSHRRGQAPSFFFSSEQRALYRSQLLVYDSHNSTPLRTAARLAAGQMVFFAHNIWDVGVPPRWHRNAFTGQVVPANLHWSKIPDFGFGDIKVVWEPSRFGFVYALVRSYWRTGDERYAESFWQLLGSWRENNPPQLGANWKCGQETAFRVMAWIFGLYGFSAAAATTPERLSALAQMIAISAYRIEANLNYALSQRNNHGISEGVGLWTVGLLFPEFKRSAVWREKGRRVLERLGRELIYDDGSFVQHSVNYQRLMLHDYLWALRLGDIQHRPFSPALRERVASAGEMLYQMQDEETGRVPYYGQNDGALVLPLNNCDYLDFRPVIQATCYLATGKRRYPSGPWDEDLLWLFGPEALSASIDAKPRADLRAGVGGYYTLRSQAGFAFVRCATYNNRPGQADMLHFDLWWRGQNIATDAGTYSYNAPDPWDNSLAHTAYHNTVTVDGLSQMERASKFLWLPWLRGSVWQDRVSTQHRLSYWEGEHDGYQRLRDPVTHRRGILRIAGEIWLVLDALMGVQEHDYRLHWLFPDWPFDFWPDAGELRLQTGQGRYYVHLLAPNAAGKPLLARAEESTPRGWRAPYYSYREPALSLALNVHADSAFYATLFSPSPSAMKMENAVLRLSVGERRVSISLAPGSAPALITSATLAGDICDELVIG